MFFRIRRGAPESEHLPLILLLLFGGIAAAVVYSRGQLLPLGVAFALGVSTLVLYFRFAYVVESRLGPLYDPVLDFLGF